MSYTNTTSHYGLPQYVATDKPKYLTDFNETMQAIDGQMYINAQAAATADGKAVTAQNTADANTSSISTLSTQINGDPTDPSDTGLAGDVSGLEGNVNTINSLIGNGTPTTTDKTIIGAINELNSGLGTASTDILGLSSKVGLGTDMYQFFKNKKVLIIGDSNSVEGEDWRGRTWVSDFREMLEGTGATITNESISGMRVAKSAGYTDTLVDTVDDLSSGDWDYVILFVGINDWNNQSELGSLDVSSSFDFTKFCDSLTYCTNTLYSKAAKAGIFVVTPLNCRIATRVIPLLAYSNALKGISGRGVASGHDITIIDGFCAPNYIINGANATDYSMDGLHPNAAYAPILARYIVESMMNGGSALCKASVTKNLTLNANVVDQATSWGRYTILSDGSVEIFLDLTLASGATYAPFITNGIPSYLLDSEDSAIWLAAITGTGLHMVDYLDSANNSPYPSNDHLDAGTKYKVKVKLRPRSMNITIYE